MIYIEIYIVIIRHYFSSPAIVLDLPFVAIHGKRDWISRKRRKFSHSPFYQIGVKIRISRVRRKTSNGALEKICKRLIPHYCYRKRLTVADNLDEPVTTNTKFPNFSLSFDDSKYSPIKFYTIIRNLPDALHSVMCFWEILEKHVS